MFASPLPTLPSPLFVMAAPLLDSTNVISLALANGYKERRPETSSTLFFSKGTLENAILLNIFHTTRGVMTHIDHPTSGKNSLWRAAAYDSLEDLDLLLKDPR